MRTGSFRFSPFHVLLNLHKCREFTFSEIIKNHIYNFITNKSNEFFFFFEFSRCQNDGEKVMQQNVAYVIQ